VEIAVADLGESYDVKLYIGKLLTWLTGIKWFQRLVQDREREICISRVAYWYWEAIGEKFGLESWHDATTDLIDWYCYNHPEEWEVITIKSEYENFIGEE